MSVLAASTNDAYEGAPSAWRFLAAIGVLTLLPGCIHVFLPDGGAGVIAGLDLSHSRSTIINVFAWAGATQIVHGAAMLAVALRYRPLVPLFLLLTVVERAVMSLNWWVLKPSDTGHRPPEVWATVVLFPVLLYFLARSLGSRAPASRAFA